MPKGFMATAPVKEIWIGEMTRQLHCTMLKLLTGNPENKVDFRDEVWQWAPFDQNASLLLKPNNAFLGYLGNATTQLLLMNGTILEIQNLSIQSVRCRSKSQND
jgi:hypothetical protein